MKAEAVGDYGVACPKCGCRHVPVVETRPGPRRRIRRRRECRFCGYRFSTYEICPDGEKNDA